MTAICQKALPDVPWMEARTHRLPGVQPLDPSTWIVVDDAYAAQMAERARLMEKRRSDIVMSQPSAFPAAQELLDEVTSHLSQRHNFELTNRQCIRPDGTCVDVDRNAPLETLSRLVSEDFCILQKDGNEHVLTAGLLCFPASWTLSQKFGHPLIRIHQPVESYTDDIAKRVQRLFDAVQVGRPLWRANAMRYRDPALYQPRPEVAPRTDRVQGNYIRSERQCILRLPKSDAVVFSIHTRQVQIDRLSAEQLAGLKLRPIDDEGSVPSG